ncbi:MAG: FAD-binding oxidoreductase, partial [Bacteroidia bacterium]|nr:FAD-binding oxidoreductase [Bacteroidia bacterium]
MQYNQVTAELLQQFCQITGEQFVLTGKESTVTYARDYTEDLVYYPDVVIKPGTTAEVAAVVRLCAAANIPVTPRGAGTGLSGGALP